jgi:hypothetical protein
MPERDVIEKILRPALRELSDDNLLKVHKLMETADVKTLYTLLGCFKDDLSLEVKRRNLDE